MNRRLEYFNQVVMAYEGDDCLIWPFSRGAEGYARLTINRVSKVVSRMVCIEEHGQPPTNKHEAAHSCGKGSSGCVTKRHLSWKTPKENWADRFEHGTHNTGSRNGRAKLDYEKAQEIRKLFGEFTQVGLSKKYHVSQSVISEIINGKTWI